MSIGEVLLIVFLALWGLLAVTNFSLEQSGLILGLVALASAIFRALRR